MDSLAEPQFPPKDRADEGMDDVVVHLAGMAQVRALGLGREDVPQKLADKTKYSDAEVSTLNVHAIDNDHKSILSPIDRRGGSVQDIPEGSHLLANQNKCCNTSEQEVN